PECPTRPVTTAYTTAASTIPTAISAAAPMMSMVVPLLAVPGYGTRTLLQFLERPTGPCELHEPMPDQPPLSPSRPHLRAPLSPSRRRLRVTFYRFFRWAAPWPVRPSRPSVNRRQRWVR